MSVKLQNLALRRDPMNVKIQMLNLSQITDFGF
jgi:hypothetical protein